MQYVLPLLLLIILSHGVLFAEPIGFQTENPIQIVHPAENAHLPAINSSFVFGSAPPEGNLMLNGIPVPIHPGGGFLAMVNLSPGEFQIEAELRLGAKTYHFVRTIQVAHPEQLAPDLPLTIEYVTPSQDQELLPGDYLEVVCKGSPGKKGYFIIKGLRKNCPMTESKPGLDGIYRGVYRIGEKDKFSKSKIKVTLVDTNNRKQSREAKGTISLFQREFPVMAETISPNTVLRAGPALSQDELAGYLMFPPEGTILQITGRKGAEYRVRLNNTNTVWVSVNQVKLLPPGTHCSPIVAGNISLSVNNLSTLIKAPFRRKIPFKVTPGAEGKYLDITFFGAFSNTDWINNAAAGVVKQVEWFQDDEETYRMRIHTMPNSWWGYDARYEDNQFVFELRTPPAVNAKDSPLTGLSITVDPGHSADTGAVGPTGYHEKDANLAIAVKLKEKLIAKGARVIMTREANEDIPLIERPLIAWRNRADILISIHNNALPYGGNPFEKRGFGVYYNTPMSLPLAKEIHKAYAETFTGSREYVLPDDGLYYGNLALTRAPQMPSVLVESAYMIVPEEEAYLKTEGFRSTCANAIVNGIERYVRHMRGNH